LGQTAKRIPESDVNVSVSYLKTSRYFPIPVLRDNPGPLLQRTAYQQNGAPLPLPAMLLKCSKIKLFLKVAVAEEVY
jgi:hypothetical protein